MKESKEGNIWFEHNNNLALIYIGGKSIENWLLGLLAKNEDSFDRKENGYQISYDGEYRITIERLDDG